MAKELTKEQVIDGLNQLGARAAELGLLPESGGKISRRGEFLIDANNIEEDENKRMRSYRHKEYGTSGKALHAWGPDGSGEDGTGEGPLELVVFNPAEEANAIALGWSVDPVHGPGGRLVGGAAVASAGPTISRVREFAPPGQPQPFDPPAPSAAKPKAAAKPPAKPKK